MRLRRVSFSFSRPAIPVVFSLIAGILAGTGIPGHDGAAWGAVAITAMVMGYRLFKGSPVGLVALVALAGTGYLSIAPWLPRDRGPDHISHYLDSGYWWIDGTVTAVEPDPSPDRSRVIMAVERLSRKDIAHSVNGRIRLTLIGRRALSPGHPIRFFSQIRPFRSFNNPGGFDYQKHMTFQGIHGNAWVSSERLQIRDPAPVFRMQGIQQARHHLGLLMDAAGKNTDSDAVAVLKALVIGDRSGIHPELRERFNRAGVGHLLAISGLHMGIVAAVAFSGFRWLFARVPALLWQGWSRPWAAVATLFPVAAYGLLAGMSPSTQRAVIMVNLFLLSLLIGRRHDSLNTLAVAALIILLIFPPAIFSISFQLSFSAVLSIIYGMRKIGRSDNPKRKKTFFRRIGNGLKNAGLCSVLAIAGVMPITLMHFNEMSVVGVVANVALIPLAGSVGVPMGLISALLGCASDAAAIWGFRLTLEILELVLMGVDGLAQLSFAAIKTVTPSVIEAALYVMGFWALLNLRHWRGAAWVLAATGILAAIDGGYWVRDRFFHPDIRITAIDVGQGASAVIELPGGPVMMVDGGGFPDHINFDVGRQVVAPFLWRKKIATVDILVLSHPDSDHMNGLIYLARHFHVRELWTTSDTTATPGYQALMKACAENGIQIRRMHTASEKTEINGVTFEILNPPPDFFDAQTRNSSKNRNNGALVINVRFGKTSFLFTGDLLMSAERAMVRRSDPGDLAATVLFVPHHGSRTSSSPELIAAVSPSVAVVCAGQGNPFGFPHAEVVGRYHRAGSLILCTCAHGAITLKSDGDQLSLFPMKNSDLFLK